MWQNVELEGPTPSLRVERSWDREAGFITPKSKAARREVPLPPEAVRVLKEWRLAAIEKGDDGRVFPLDPDGFRNQFKRVLKEEELPDIRFHDLRGTYASIMANDPETAPKTLQRLMGHSNFAITMDIYVKFTRDDGAHAAVARKFGP